MILAVIGGGIVQKTHNTTHIAMTRHRGVVAAVADVARTTLADELAADAAHIVACDFQNRVSVGAAAAHLNDATLTPANDGTKIIGLLLTTPTVLSAGVVVESCRNSDTLRDDGRDVGIVGFVLFFR